MPDWCANHLVVSGEPKALADFTVRVRGHNQRGEPTPLSLASILPAPLWLAGHKAPLEESDFCWPADFMPDPTFGPNQAAIEGDKHLLLADEFAWRIVRWGTKWDLEVDTELGGSPEAGEITYDFYAICAPPVPWVAAAGNFWPSLTFDLCYAEPVSDLAGRIKLRAGVYDVDEMWAGPEAHDQLRALGGLLYRFWVRDLGD